MMIRKISLSNINGFAVSAIIGLAVLAIAGEVLARGDRLNLNFQLQTVYDDNVLNYSDTDLDLLDDPSVPDNKYGIKSQDDIIIIPELDIVYKTRLAGHSLHAGVKGSYYYYRENDIKRYFRIEGYFKRYFMKGTYFQGSVNYLPDYYYRNSYSSTEGYQEADFNKLSARGKLSVQLINNLRGNFQYTFTKKDFIPLFDERDITEHEVKAEAIYRPIKLWKGWLSYAFSSAKGAGANNTTFRRDTSFDENSFTLGSRFYFSGLRGRGIELAGLVNYKVIYFQTVKVTTEDRYRLGREDYRWNLTLMAKHAISADFNIGLNFNRMTKSVDLPAEDLIDVLESNSNSVYLILEYSL